MVPLPALTLNLCVQIEFNFVSMGKITTVNVSERYINDLCIFVRFFLLNDGADYIGINDSNIWKSTF